MSAIGDVERKTQRRIMRLFVDALGYENLGDLSDCDNRNINEAQLEHFLWAYQGYAKRPNGDRLMRRAITEFVKAADNTGVSLYDRNRAVYELLRYGVKVKADVGAQNETVWLIDWKNPEKNRFAIAEDVTVRPADAKAHGKRPDIVLYVNGIALAVLELKRSTVSVAEGIRQNLDNQKKEFIQPFFSTMQYIMAGSDSEGLRYGTIQTQEKYYLTWKEERPGWRPGDPPQRKYLTADDYPKMQPSPLERALVQVCSKQRFLELLHDFIIFDAGTKKLCRHNQYFGVLSMSTIIDCTLVMKIEGAYSAQRPAIRSIEALSAVQLRPSVKGDSDDRLSFVARCIGRPSLRGARRKSVSRFPFRCCPRSCGKREIENVSGSR